MANMVNRCFTLEILKENSPTLLPFNADLDFKEQRIQLMQLYGIQDI